MSSLAWNWRIGARMIALYLMLAGAAIVILAFIGPRIGLGEFKQSVFYIWLGLTRSNLAYGGAAILVVGAGAAILAATERLGVLFTNMALTVVAIIMSLLVLELLARAVDGIPLFAFQNWLAARNALLTTSVQSDYDPLVGWVIKSNLVSPSADPAKSFSTGPYGIRLNRPGAGPPPAGAILAVGDSFTAGSEVGDGQSWPAQLEALLGRPVVNAAAGGWGTDQIILRTENLLPVLSPSGVIVSFLADDIGRSGLRVYGSAGKPFFTVEDGALVLHNQPVPRYTGRVEETPFWLIVPSYSYLVLAITDRLGWANWWQTFTVSYVRAENDPIAVTCALLRRLQGELKTRGTPFLFVMQYGGMVMPSKPDDAVSVVACAREAGIDTLDLWDDLAAVHDRSFDEYVRLWVSFDGRGAFGHMSAAGNRFVTDRIAAKLAVEH